ncbi:MAG: hypothetical protein WDN75_20780 [Bacteroidota bacterium]
MIKPQIFSIIVLIFSVHTAPCQSSITASEKTLTYLKKFRTDFSNAQLNEKPEAIQPYFADDIRLMPEFQKTIMSKSNASLYWKSFAARFDTQEYRRTETEILDLGSRILETGSFSMKMKLKSDGKIFELKGKYFDLWKKDNEQILLLTQAWNYDHAVNFTDQLKFTEVPPLL